MVGPKHYGGYSLFNTTCPRFLLTGFGKIPELLAVIVCIRDRAPSHGAEVAFAAGEKRGTH